jgi:hypothetical protein
MSKGMGRRAIERHLSAADEGFGPRLGAGLDGTHVAAVTFALLLFARPRQLGATAQARHRRRGGV